MEDRKRIKLEGGVEISQEAFEKIRMDAVNDYRLENMACNSTKELAAEKENLSSEVQKLRNKIAALIR